MRTHSRYSMGDAAALVEAAQREAALKLEPMEVWAVLRGAPELKLEVLEVLRGVQEPLLVHKPHLLPRVDGLVLGLTVLRL